MIELNRFKDGKIGAVTLSYDDGTTYDKQLIEILNRYQMKATFHINSEFFGTEGKIPADEAEEIFRGHEVAVHGSRHRFPTQLPPQNIIYEIFEDRRRLESIVHYPVTGLSYAFGDVNETVINGLKTCGIVYGRTTHSTFGFRIPNNFLTWDPTCHHNDCLTCADRFLSFLDKNRFSLFYVWGHAYEFNNNNNWDLIEEFCKKVHGDDRVWYATNMEIYEYIEAVKRLVISADNRMVYNPSAIDVWVSNDGKTVKIPAGASVTLDPVRG